MLRTVAVMDVPVDHQDSAHAEPRTQRGDCDRHVVQETEAHGLVLLAVVARRAGDGEGVAQLALRHTGRELHD